MKKLRNILLSLMGVLIAATIYARWWAGRQKITYPLYLQELDQFQLPAQGEKSGLTTFTQSLMVGQDAPEGQQRTFTVQVQDLLPPGSALEDPRGSTIKGRAFCGDDLSIPVERRPTPEGTELTFHLNSVPAADLEDGDCCGCGELPGGEKLCGGVCGATWSYQARAPLPRPYWPTARIVSEPETLKVETENRVVVRVTPTLPAAAQGHFSLAVPKKVPGATLELEHRPDDLHLQEVPDRFLFLTGRLPRDEAVRLVLKVRPARPGPIPITRFLTVTAVWKRLFFPAASLSWDQPALHKTRQTTVLLEQDLGWMAHAEP